MKAKLLLQERYRLEDSTFAEIRIWRVPWPVRGSAHEYKYALALVSEEECVLRYDNEAGKGDHRHLDGVEESYAFTTAVKLVEDFWQSVANWRRS